MSRPSLRLVLCTAALAALPAPRLDAADVVVTIENGGKLVSKTGDLTPNVFGKDGEGKATTTFKFHPEDVVTSAYTKNTATKVVNPNPFTHNYTKAEGHGTKGKARYDLSLGEVVVDGKKAFSVGGKLTGDIQPGNSQNKLKVSIQGDLKDPFAFSSDPDAQFGPHPEGLDYSFSLLAGTAFPDVFAPNPDSFGAIASETSMTMLARVAPGFISDPDAFWSDGLPGSIDLFTLILTSDVDHNVTAELTLGASTAGFLLNLPADVDAIETAIEMAFVGGVLTGDLEDLFTVGFTPSGSVTQYTFGTRTTLDLGAVEVPEPSTLLMCGTAAALGLAVRRRRRGRETP